MLGEKNKQKKENETFLLPITAMQSYVWGIIGRIDEEFLNLSGGVSIELLK